MKDLAKLDAEALAKLTALLAKLTALEISAVLAGDPVARAENVKKVDLMRQREERNES